MPESKGRVHDTMRTTTFRLGDETLADLDWLVGQVRDETGDQTENRTTVFRKLVKSERRRRERRGQNQD